MKKTMMKRLMSWVLAAAMVVAMLPVSVLGAESGGNVAKIGDTEYATLDEAVEKAAEGATIELLTDCELTKGFNKTLTFTGNGKISINKQLTSNGEAWMCFGLYDPTRVLTFDGAGVEVEWNSEVGTSPWLMLSLSGTLNVTNGAKLTFTVDSGATGSRNAIYMNAGSVINVTNGSSFTINGNETAGKAGQGIQLDKTAQSTINVTGNSSFTIDGTNRGYVNSPTIYVEDSTFAVQNCTSNASNGGKFTAINSVVNYSNNAGHGLSAGSITLQNSKLTANNNGNFGITASGNITIDGTSVVTSNGNGAGTSGAGLRASSAGSVSIVKSGAKITLNNNFRNALENYGTFTFEEGVDLEIIGNHEPSNGGGVYNNTNATMVLPSDAVIYNNHADKSGDDIMSRGSITFGKVGADWVLDDCDHLIDGWYDDGPYGANTNRWEAHAEDAEQNHIELCEGFDEETGLKTVTGDLSLKAAHGTDPKDKVSYPGLDKKVGDDDEAMNDDDVDAAAGQKVNFQLTSNVPTDLLNYLNPEDVTPPSIDGEEPGTAEKVELKGRGEYVLTFHDKLNEKLTNPENYVVKIGVTVLTAEQYTLTATGLEDGCSFEIALDLAALYEAGVITDDDIKNATPITVTYDATLSADATAGSYENTAWVTAPRWETSKDIVYVNTYAIDIFKYDQAEPTKGLKGAEFELYQKDTEGNVIETSKKTLISGADGKILVDGLDAGTYYLKETKAPEGYVCSTAELEIVIPEKAGVNNTVGVSFANSQIPHTGGTGTLMFTIGGIALMGTAGLLLVVSRKKRKAIMS